MSGSVTPVMKKDASSGAVEVEIEDGMMKSPATGLGAKFPVSGSPYVAPRKKGADVPGLEEAAHPMPPASVMTRLILIMVWRKLVRNPNTYSSLIGLTWSLVAFRYVRTVLLPLTWYASLILPVGTYIGTFSFAGSLAQGKLARLCDFT